MDHRIYWQAEIVETNFVFPTLHRVRYVFVYFFFVSPLSCIYKDLTTVYTNENWFVILLSRVDFGA